MDFEQLSESFAFLTGQIREEMRLTENEVAYETLRAVAPALLRAVPARALVECAGKIPSTLRLAGFACSPHPDFESVEECALESVVLRQEPAGDFVRFVWRGAPSPVLFVPDWELWRFLVEQGTGQGLESVLFGGLRDILCAPALARFVRVEGKNSATVRLKRRLPPHLAAKLQENGAFRAQVALFENRFVASAEPVFLRPPALPDVPNRYPLSAPHEILDVRRVVALSSRRMGLREEAPFRYLFGKLALEPLPPLFDTLSVEAECCDGRVPLEGASALEWFPYIEAPIFDGNLQEMTIRFLRAELDTLSPIEDLKSLLRFLARGADREMQELIEAMQGLKIRHSTALHKGFVLPCVQISIQLSHETPKAKALELALQQFFWLKSPLNTQVILCLSA
jgi:hypothetical protein